MHLPATDTENAELERLWALDMIHAIEKQNLLGLISDAEAKARIVALGVEYQLVTDYTSMVVVDGRHLREVRRGAAEQEAGRRRKTAVPSGGGSYGGHGGNKLGAGSVDRFLLALFLFLLGGLASAAFSGRRGRRGAAQRFMTRPSHRGWAPTLLRRGPWVATVLTLLAVAARSRAELQFEREAIFLGEVWRLLTCHFVHYGPAHSVGDIVAFAVCGVADRSRFPTSARIRRTDQQRSGVVRCAAFLSGCVTHYRGLSGVDVGLFVVLLGVLWSCRRVQVLPLARVWIKLAALGLALKTGYEFIVGSAILAPDLGAGVELLPGSSCLWRTRRAAGTLGAQASARRRNDGHNRRLRMRAVWVALHAVQLGSRTGAVLVRPEVPALTSPPPRERGRSPS